MATIKCPYIMCKHNSCSIPEEKGECQNDGLIELEVKDIHEIPGFEEGVPCKLEDECLMKCSSFIYDKEKAIKINN